MVNRCCDSSSLFTYWYHWISHTFFLSWCGCFVSTFCNPYGYRIWEEIWTTMSDSILSHTITEWIPALANPLGIGLFFYISLAVVFLPLCRKRFSVLELVLSISLLLAGFFS